jgi:hypothetical protein
MGCVNTFRMEGYLKSNWRHFNTVCSPRPHGSRRLDGFIWDFISNALWLTEDTMRSSQNPARYASCEASFDMAPMSQYVVTCQAASKIPHMIYNITLPPYGASRISSLSGCAISNARVYCLYNIRVSHVSCWNGLMCSLLIKVAPDMNDENQAKKNTPANKSPDSSTKALLVENKSN